jgi:GntR family transcriptional regulator
MADPMWRRIAENLRQKIESGDLGGDGQALPSELELQDTYNASRNTVRDAVKWLISRGLVETRPGQGTFAVQSIDPFVTSLSADIRASSASESVIYASEVAARSRQPKSSLPRVEIQHATGLVAGELGLAEGAAVVSRHQERFIDGTPWSLQTSFYPMSLVESGAARLIEAADLTDGTVAYIEGALGIKQVGWRDTFMVRAPDRHETEFFSLPDDGRIAVIEIVRTGYSQSGVPIRVTITTYPADRNQFVMTGGTVPDEASAAPGR